MSPFRLSRLYGGIRSTANRRALVFQDLTGLFASNFEPVCLNSQPFLKCPEQRWDQADGCLSVVSGEKTMTSAATQQSRIYDIRFEHRPHSLYVRVFGDEHSYDVAKRYWKHIVAMLHRRHYERVLVDKDFPQQLSIAASHLLMSELAHSGCRTTKVAIVDRNYDEDLSHFEEMVATNRGLTVRYFSNLDSAEEWLGH